MRPRLGGKILSILTLSSAIVFTPTASLASSPTYTVRQGDSLSLIQHVVNIPWQVLADLNHINAPYIIHSGDVLKLSAPRRSTEPEDPSGRSSRVKFKEVPSLVPVLAAPFVPTSVDSLTSSYDYNLGPVAPQTLAAAEEIGPMFGITSMGGFATSGHIKDSDHYTGLAIDVMINNLINGKQIGDDVAAYALANRVRLDISYIIWYRHIWTEERGWHEYVGPSDHTDHIHISFNN